MQELLTLTMTSTCVVLNFFPFLCPICLCILPLCMNTLINIKKTVTLLTLSACAFLSHAHVRYVYVSRRHKNLLKCLDNRGKFKKYEYFLTRSDIMQKLRNTTEIRWDLNVKKNSSSGPYFGISYWREWSVIFTLGCDIRSID